MAYPSHAIEGEMLLGSRRNRKPRQAGGTGELQIKNADSIAEILEESPKNGRKGGKISPRKNHPWRSEVL